MATSVEVRGLKETQRRLTQAVRDINGPPVVNAMRNATLIVQRDAKINAPVDTGRLRASITPSVMTSPVLQGVIGSNVVYAPMQELGTKWMRARRYLQKALEDNAERIVRLLGDAVATICRKANG